MSDTLFPVEPTFAVDELNAAIGMVLQQAFADDVWVRGEIANLSRPSTGHVYFDLCGEGCSIGVTLWASDKAVVNGILRRAGGAVRMTDGTEVRIRARVSWYAKAGRVTLRMLAIDPAFTLGRLAEARERLVAALRAEGLLARQQELVLAPVPLRIGLVTSARSAAEADFLHTLESSGFAWDVVAADARVQGIEAESSVVSGLRALAALGSPVEAICVVRGGGARTDLEAFDREQVARTIATLPVPVLTGIGHETDTSVADLVAHGAHKTPTACANALVERVAAWRQRLDQCWQQAGRAGSTGLDRSAGRLERASGRAAAGSRHHLQSQRARLDGLHQRLHRRPGQALDGAAQRLAHTEARVRALDPARVLARGWSITRTADGHLVRHPAEAPGGTRLVTVVAGGTLLSTVEP